MAKVKKRKTQSRLVRTIYGIEHEFVLIGGGGFLVIVLGMILFF